MSLLLGQGNCLIYPEDSGERKACEISYQAIKFQQGSKESQLLFDEAIRIGPNYAWAYYQKSVPYFKRGLFAEGYSLISKAIELEPHNYLYYRAYWYFYNYSFTYCIKDLEAYYTTTEYAYCTTPGGDVEMRLLLAVSHAKTGNVSKGIYWMEHLIEYYKDEPYLQGMYDHFCLGVLYFKNKQFDLAQKAFEKQLLVESGLADTYYYLGLIQEEQSEHIKARELFEQALSYINRENGGFTTTFLLDFNINRQQIEAKISS